MNRTPFARLLGLQRTGDARERLNRLRQEYALTDHDPLWDLVAVVEEFCLELKAESGRSGSSSVTPDQTPSQANARALHRTGTVVLCCAAAALQTFLLATSAYIGAHAIMGEAWFGAMLSVPVGWVVFALLLPVVVAVIYRGWRGRLAEPGIGWTLMLGGMGACVAMLVALWRSL